MGLRPVASALERRDHQSELGFTPRRTSHRPPACDQRSCDLAKDTETVTLRVSRAPRGVTTVKLGAEAC